MLRFQSLTVKSLATDELDDGYEPYLKVIRISGVLGK